MVLDQVDDAVDAAVHRAAVVVLTAEIHAAGPLLILCHMKCVVYQLIHALILGGGDGDDRDAKHGLHLVDAHRAATKLVEGDQRIEEALKLDQNEKEMIEHIIVQMEQERGLDRAAAIADMRFSLDVYKRQVPDTLPAPAYPHSWRRGLP